MTNPETVVEFECPQCGSNQFGSSLGPPPSYETVERQCHGGLCRFVWFPADDWKYFIEVTKRKFSSAEEYRRRGNG